MDKPKHVAAFFFPACRAEKETYWRPPVDVYRIRHGWLLKFDLAGVPMEDVSVHLEGCRVTVAGVRRDWVADEDAAYYSMEIAYSRFERTIELPCSFANPRVQLESRNGILMIRIVEE